MTPPTSMRLHAGRRPHRDRLALVGLLVGDNAHGVAADPRVSAQHRAAKLVLVLVELAAIDDARNDLAHVVNVAGARRGIQQPVHVFGRKLRRIALRDRIRGG